MGTSRYAPFKATATVMDAIEFTITDRKCWKVDHASDTGKTNKAGINAWAEYYPKVRINSLTQGTMNEWRDLLHRDRDIGPRTVNLYKGVIQTALNHCITTGKLPKLDPNCPWSSEGRPGYYGFHSLNQLHVERPTLKKEEVHHMAQVAKAWSWSDLGEAILFSSFTGCGWGEFSQIKACDVHMEASVPYVSIGTDRKDFRLKRWCRARQVRMHPDSDAAVLIPIISRRLEEAKHDPDICLFGDSWTHVRRFQEQFAGIRDHLWPARQNLTAYCLRHSFCTWLIQAGIEITTVSKMMGHASIKQTMTYVHHSNNLLDEAAALV